MVYTIALVFMHDVPWVLVAKKPELISTFFIEYAGQLKRSAALNRCECRRVKRAVDSLVMRSPASIAARILSLKTSDGHQVDGGNRTNSSELAGFQTSKNGRRSRHELNNRPKQIGKAESGELYFFEKCEYGTVVVTKAREYPESLTVNFMRPDEIKAGPIFSFAVP